jgi:hypothetical protein
MAQKIIPCGGRYIDGTTLTFDENKVLSATGGGEGSFLPLAGGTMEADAVIEGTDNIEISVGDTTQSSVVGVTQSGVTIEHNTNSEADSSIRAIDNAIEIMANSTNVTFNGTGVDFNGANITGLASLTGESSGEIAIETTLDMNNHNITNVNDPQNAQDVATKNYVDTTKPTNATTSTAGLVKQSLNVAEIADVSASTTAETVAQTVNDLIQQLIAAGIMASA